MQHRLRWPRRLPHFGLASAASELSHFSQESSGAYLYASMPVRGKGDGGWRRGLQCSYPFRRRGNETPYGSLRDGTVALLARGTTMQLHRTLSAPHAIRPGRRHIGICAALMLVGAGLGPARDGARRRRPRRARMTAILQSITFPTADAQKPTLPASIWK
jgi:hypothetical protein